MIGGAYQGKLTYAKNAFHLSSEDIFTCTGTEIDFRKRCIRSIEEFTYACVQAGIDAAAYFAAHREEWENSILICRDIFCGVVPLGADNRAWRHAADRANLGTSVRQRPPPSGAALSRDGFRQL